jgi:hypothetical protein
MRKRDGGGHEPGLFIANPAARRVARVSTPWPVVVRPL